MLELPAKPAFSGRRRLAAMKAPRDARRLVEMRAYAVRSDDSILDLQVVNLSYDGCAVETQESLIPGEFLKLSVLGRGFVNATVRWYQQRKAGLQFNPERVNRDMEERSAERLHIAAEIKLRRSGRISYPVQTVDLNRFGCKCEFIERPSIGETVWVKFSGLETVESEVCWLAEANVGLKFKTPIHPAVFTLLMNRLAP
jgi:hypothetical protein